MKLSKYTKLGILIVFASAVLVWGLSYLKGNDIFKKNDYYHVYYSRVDGLVKSNKVTLNGFEVGQVSSVGFAPGNTGKLWVTFAVRSDFKIPKNSIARIVSSDLMGTRSIKLIYSGENSFYSPNDTILGAVEHDLKEQVSLQVLPLKSKAEELLATLDSAITVLTVIFNEDARENITESFKNFNKTLNNLESTTADLEDLVGTQKDTIRNIIGNVNAITTTFAANAESLEAMLQNLSEFSDTLSDVSISPLLGNITDISEKLSLTLDKLEGKESTAGMLLNDTELYESVSLLTENLGFLVSDLQQNPRRYLKFSALDFGKDVYVNTKSKASDKGIVFKVKLLSSKTKVDLDNKLFKEVGKVEEYFSKNNYVYLVGATSSYDEIAKVHKSVRLKFPESEIIASRKGKLITLKKALRLMR